MSIKHCRLSKKQQDRLLECFVRGVPARTATHLLEINKTPQYTFLVVFGKSLHDVSALKHYQVNQSEECVVAGHNHINGIENFWSQAKRHLRKYNGIPKQNFHLFLKECEFRFNYGTPRELLEQLRVWIKRA